MEQRQRTRLKSVQPQRVLRWCCWSEASGGDPSFRPKAKLSSFAPIGYSGSAMNQTVRLPKTVRIGHSACPHDCPSTCALDVEIIDERTIGRVRGAKDDPYTAGVICEKVARYAERIHNPDRLTHPLRRAGKKGEGRWERIGWDEALDEIVARWTAIEAEFG